MEDRDRLEEVVERMEKAAEHISSIKKELNRLRVAVKKGYITAINISNIASKLKDESMFILGDEMRKIQGEEERAYDSLSEHVRALSSSLSTAVRFLKEVVDRLEKGD